MENANGEGTNGLPNDTEERGVTNNIRTFPTCPSCLSQDVIQVGNLDFPDRKILVCISCQHFVPSEVQGHPHWPYLLKFAIAISKKMRLREVNANQDEVAQGGPGWRSTHAMDLLDRLFDEVDELSKSLSLGTFCESMDEACDVAAFAGMIYDKAEQGKQMLAKEKFEREANEGP